jgi:cephalosporin-C deacetylase-like acetyl esterase
VVALSIEGPGQGQTRSLGLPVGLDNYERAIETYADYLAGLPQFDPTRIGTFGISMSGYTEEEDAFDADLKARMPLGDLVTRITRPVLMGIGEFDELTPVQAALATYERISAPKEMRVYETTSIHSASTPPRCSRSAPNG